MKFILSFLLLPLFSYANEDMQRKLLEMERKIKQLEKGKASSGIKTQDLENQEISNQSSSVPSASQLSPEQQKELMKQIEQIKKSQKEQQKVLDEIMNEDL